MTKQCIIWIGCLLLFGAGCNKQLDLAPENTLVDSEVFKTEAGTEQALAEVYFSLLRAVTSNIGYVYGDFTTGNLQHSAYYDSYTNGQGTPDDEGIADLWALYFKSINLANKVIAGIPAYAAYPKEKQDVLMAEARFIRAYAYLDLLKFFGEGALNGQLNGLGLPLQLTPFKGYNTGEVIARSTNGEVYTQIIKDLEESIPALKDNQPNELRTRSRATKGSALALLARTYLYMGKPGDAAAAARQVLAKVPSIYALTPSLLSLFPANPTGTAQTLTNEYVLALPVSHMVSSSTSTNNNLGNGYYFKRSFWISKTFIQSFETGDNRVSELIFKGDQVYNTDHLDEFTTFKFNNPNGRDNVPLIRLPEVMLTAAEAITGTEGVKQEAVNLLNEVRSRSVPGAQPYVLGDFPDAAALTSAILRQKRWELAFEGFYRYDLIRTGQPLQLPDLPENRKVLPLPQVEIDISKGIIKQNTGY